MLKNNILVSELLKNDRRITKLMRGGKCIYRPMQEYKEEEPTIKARLMLSDDSVVDIPFVDADDHTLLRSETEEYLGNLLSAEVFDGVTTLEDNVFGGLDVGEIPLTSATLPNGLTTIGEFAFGYCDGLTSINIPDGVTTIGTYAFSHCESLPSIAIPANVTSIEDCAFEDCFSLTAVTVSATTPPTIGEQVFKTAEGDILDILIYVPCEAVDDYKTAWSEYIDRIQAIS